MDVVVMFESDCDREVLTYIVCGQTEKTLGEYRVRLMQLKCCRL